MIFMVFIIHHKMILFISKVEISEVINDKANMIHFTSFMKYKYKLYISSGVCCHCVHIFLQDLQFPPIFYI